jgi:hypothetical protein
MPVGNIAEPAILKKGLIFKDEKSSFGIAVAPEADVVLDRNLKDQKKDTQYWFYGGRAGIIITDKAFLYGICGAANAKQEFKNISGSVVRWDTDLDLSWGAGATLIVYEKEITIRDKSILRVGLDGRFRQSDLDVDKVIRDGVEYKKSDNTVTTTKFNYQEWQAALAISYIFNDRIIPYVGVKYSDVTGKAKAIISGTEYSKNFKPQDNVGVFVGGDVVMGDSFSLYVEGRFIDETAVSAGGTIRF